MDSNKNCIYCNSCDSCDSCNSCNYCNYCNYCYYCNYCNYSKNIRQSEYIVFGIGNGKHDDTDLGYHRKHNAFNKSVTEKRFFEIKNNVSRILSGLEFTAYKTYAENWKQVTNTQWIELSKIPEFDKSVVEQITGLTLNLTTEIIIIGGITYDKKEVERKSKDIKPL